MKKLVKVLVLGFLILVFLGILRPAEQELPQKVFFQDFTFSEIKALGETKATVIIPVAQIEAKGPHLPVGADLYACLEICRRAAEKAGGIVGPPIPFGTCQDFTAWPGYIVVDTQTMISIFHHYCQSLHKQGFGRLVFLTMAGGNSLNTLRLAAGEYFRKYPSVDIVVTSFFQMVSRSEIEKILQKGGDPLMSILLAIRPNLVKLDLIENIQIKGNLSDLRKAYCFRENYKLSNFFPDAVLRPVNKGSSKEIGESLIEIGAETLARLCKEK